MKYLHYFSLILLFFQSCVADIRNDQSSSTVLWYEQPAREWLEALPLGNGRLGAMVYGGIDKDILQLNEESLWAGEPFEAYPDQFAEGIKEVQKLVLEGNISEAKKTGLEKLTAKPTSFRSYQPLCNIEIDMLHNENYTDYYRELDLVSGVVKVTYKTGGIKYLKEYFISAPDNVLVVRISSDTQNSVNGSVRIKREKDAVFRSLKDTLVMSGQIIDIEAPEAYDDNPGGSGPGGEHMKFAGKLIARASGGKTESKGDSLLFSGCNRLVLFFTAATDYKLEEMNFDRSLKPLEEVEDILRRIKAKSYQAIRMYHEKEHSRLFNRVELSLDTTGISRMPTDKRLMAVAQGKADPQFNALYFNYGRYLLMSGSRSPGILPLNLQGIWNDRMWAPWEADYHLNINLQMNYWPADVCNLPETVMPLTRWLSKAAEKGRISAGKLYNSDGWMLYTATNPFGRSTPSASTIQSQFMNGSLDPLPGAWMSLTTWRHYEYGLDEDYLEDYALPLLKGASRFLLDYMLEDESGKLVIVPSTSPENSFIDPGTGEILRITKGSTYHSSIVREVLGSTLKAMDIGGNIDSLRAEIEAALPLIPPIRIGADGTIMEWIEEYEEAEPGHRHMSHLIGLHPFAQITPDDKELFAASAATIKKRLEHGGGHTGWSRAWMVNFAARLLDGEAAAAHLQRLYSKSTNPNLFDQHPPFQIDGNFGATAGIAEMLMQSHEAYIRVLPALPPGWKNGSVKGLCARGGFVVDIEWKEGEITDLKVGSAAGGTLTLKYRDREFELETKAGIKYDLI